jgi:pilus assembly protein Flp/PilA
MLKFIREVAKRRREDEGATAVEYGLLVAAIAALIVLLVFALGGYVKGAFKKTCDALSNGGGGSFTGSTAVTTANCNS